MENVDTLTAEELVEDIKTGVLRQQLENLIPKFWSFFWCVILALIVFVVGRQIIKGVIKLFHKTMSLRDIDSGVESFLESVLKWICYIVLFTIILGLFGVTTTSITAGLAGLTVTAGLALQGALSNFAGGILILIMRPFKVGDYIIEHGKEREGTVCKINIIYTTLEMIDGRYVQLPNGTLAATAVTNCTAQSFRLFNETIGISYDSDIKMTKEILYEVAKEEEYRTSDCDIIVFVSDLADSSVKLGLRFPIKVEYFWRVKWDTLEKIKERFDNAGIEICYNQIDVHMK